jgi:hypothetical protein
VKVREAFLSTHAWGFFFLATNIYAEDINFSIFLAPENNNGA